MTCQTAESGGLKLAGVIVAAGLSSRMGEFKPLLPLHGKPVLLHEIDQLLSAGADSVVVVTGWRGEEVERALRGVSPRVRTVRNPRYREDMFLSVQAGVRALSADTDAFFFLPADCPAVSADTMRLLAETFRRDRPRVCFPVYQGRRGHPPLISCDLREDLLSFGGEGGLRQFLRRWPAEEVPVDDAEICRDMDTPEEYRRVLDSQEGASPARRGRP